MPDPNTPTLWNALWAGSPDVHRDAALLEQEGACLRWRRIERLLLREHPTLEGLRVAEIGAGTGVYSALFARSGASVTLVDYAESALARSRALFASQGLQAAFIQADALAPPAHLKASFDVVMSFGLAEHFRGEPREQIVRSHFTLLRPGGTAVISVPNALNLAYRLFKFLSERTGEWSVGEEYPFTRGELKRMMRTFGIDESTFLADSLSSSVDFLRRTPGLRRFLLPRDGKPVAPIREIATPLDPYLAYALVLCAKRGPRFVE